jgi:hypothetical protein
MTLLRASRRRGSFSGAADECQPPFQRGPTEVSPAREFGPNPTCLIASREVRHLSSSRSWWRRTRPAGAVLGLRRSRRSLPTSALDGGQGPLALSRFLLNPREEGPQWRDRPHGARAASGQPVRRSPVPPIAAVCVGRLPVEIESQRSAGESPQAFHVQNVAPRDSRHQGGCRGAGALRGLRLSRAQCPDHFKTCRGLMNLTAHLHFVTTPPGTPRVGSEASWLPGVSRCMCRMISNGPSASPKEPFRRMRK